MFIAKTKNIIKYNSSLSNYQPKEIVSFEKGIEVYLKWKKSYAPSASKRYRTRLSHFMRYTGRSISLNEITGEQIVSFHNSMISEQGYAPGTVSYSIIILKDFFEFWGSRGQSNIRTKELKRIRYATPVKETINETEFKLLTSNLDTRYYDDLLVKLVFSILWDTGCRVSEVCDLNLSDLMDTRIQGHRCASIRRRKSMKYNVVTWSKETNELLNTYLGIRLDMPIKTDALFVAKRYSSQGLTTRSVQRWVSKHVAHAGLNKNISPHSFRHSKAQRILSQSQNVRDVQAVLGHTNPASSFNYLNLNHEKLLEVSMKYLAL